MRVKIDSNQANVTRGLFNAPDRTKGELKKALFEIGKIVEDTARDYCPISPSKSQYNKTLKKKKSSRQTFTPGTLMRSITSKLKGAFAVEIFTNQTSREYAAYIHEEDYDLGPGSKSKKATGKEVGNKFIERAIEDNEDLIVRKIDKAVMRALGEG